MPTVSGRLDADRVRDRGLAAAQSPHVDDPRTWNGLVAGLGERLPTEARRYLQPRPIQAAIPSGSGCRVSRRCFEPSAFIR